MNEDYYDNSLTNETNEKNVKIKIDKLGKVFNIMSIVFTILLLIGIVFEFVMLINYNVLKSTEPESIAEPIGMVFTGVLYILSVIVCVVFNIINLVITCVAKKKLKNNNININIVNKASIIINVVLLSIQIVTFIIFLIDNVQ